MTRWWPRLVGRDRSGRELAQEIEAHIAERTDDLVDAGMPFDDARRTAVREFGNPVRYLEDSRAVWSSAWLACFGQDIGYVLRTIRRQPLFSAAVVFILTFGIGLATAYVGIAGILLASSLSATLIPAIRAARIEPAITLRGD